MTNNHDIHERIYQFVLRVLKIIPALPKNSINIILLNQLIRSATSIGANDQEADGTQSRKDFIAKYSIVRKEAKETYYWLRLITDLHTELKPRMQNLLNENEEIVKIISTIIAKANRK